uniref:2-aminoethanethiol dioxygenase n=1 Tax=Schistocephalus solidus TaxID=70667 RepID=A0A0X3NNX5_SCHSO
MTSKIAAVANLAFHVFRAHSLRSMARRTDAYSENSNSNGIRRLCASSLTNTSEPESLEEVSSDALKTLLTNVSALTLEDVGVDRVHGFDSSSFSAPVIYVHITENEIFSMGMFILRPGSRIPLHSHPGMFGIIRVMQGAVRCQSFTRLSTSQLRAAGGPLAVLSAQGAAKWQLSDFTVAQPHQDTLLNVGCEPCVLTPHTGNLHELTAVDGTVVFLDILAPPYNHDLGARECLFYREVAMPMVTADPATSSFVYLVETHQPKDYWCETAPYRGPSVS